jgi:hypothetical protein
VFTAKKDGRAITVKFLPSNDVRLDDAEIAKLSDAGAVFTFKEGSFLVAIAFDDRVDNAAAKALLDTIVVHAS